MADKDHILQLIKRSVSGTDPGATLILYGSYARGDYNEESDIDVLVLIDQEKVTMHDRERISSQLNSISLDNDVLISPFISTKQGWATHKVTPFLENVNREGILILVV